MKNLVCQIDKMLAGYFWEIPAKRWTKLQHQQTDTGTAECWQTPWRLIETWSSISQTVFDEVIDQWMIPLPLSGALAVTYGSFLFWPNSSYKPALLGATHSSEMKTLDFANMSEWQPNRISKNKTIRERPITNDKMQAQESFTTEPNRHQRHWQSIWIYTWHYAKLGY